MKIIELILGDGIFSGIEAISLVEAPAIEEEWITLKSQEVKLAEVSSEKRILLGALLVPNKPIYRKTGEDEYYIYFSKNTIEKASQLYLMNGNQNNATLEHQHTLNGLTLVESWLVEDEVHDKSRKYGLNVPIGTWMGAVKVNSEEVWEEFVKTGKVKGFSIEGYFADKAERPKEPINDMEMQAQEQLSTIRTIIKEGERVELALELGGLKSYASNLKAKFGAYQQKFLVLDRMVGDIEKEAKELDKLYDKFSKEMDAQYKEGERLSKELGIKFVETSVGKEWERISGDILSGDYSAIKRGLKIDIS